MPTVPVGIVQTAVLAIAPPMLQPALLHPVPHCHGQLGGGGLSFFLSGLRTVQHPACRTSSMFLQPCSTPRRKSGDIIFRVTRFACISNDSVCMTQGPVAEPFRYRCRVPCPVAHLYVYVHDQISTLINGVHCSMLRGLRARLGRLLCPCWPCSGHCRS